MSIVASLPGNSIQSHDRSKHGVNMRRRRSPSLKPPVWTRVPLGRTEPEEHHVVSMDHQRPKHGHGGVIEHGVSGSIDFEGGVVGVHPAVAKGKREVGGAEKIGPVERDDLVVV